MQIWRNFHTSLILSPEKLKWRRGLTKSQNSIFPSLKERERRKGILWNFRAERNKGEMPVCVCPSQFLPSIYILSLPLSLGKNPPYFTFFPSEGGGGRGGKSALERLFRIKEQRKGTLTRDSPFGQKYVKDAAVKKGRETKSWRNSRPCARISCSLFEYTEQCIAFLELFFKRARVSDCVARKCPPCSLAMHSFSRKKERRRYFLSRKKKKKVWKRPL